MAINRISPSRLGNKSVATSQDDLLTVGKALHDKLTKDLGGMVKDLETGLGLSLGKVLEVRLEKSLTAALDAQMKALRTEFEARAKAQEEAHWKELDTLRKHHEGMTADVVEALEKRITFVQDMQEGGRSEIASMIAKIQIPPPVIQVEVAPAQVHLPEQPAPVVNNILPELNIPAPVVNVAGPDMKGLPAPQVTVNTPRRKMVKTIHYSQDGRPVQIEEREEDIDG